MYKVFTPHGIIETDSLKEVQSYQAQGCPYEKIPDEFSPEVLSDEELTAMCNIAQQIPGL